jgi:hypothetical protein
VKFVRFRRLKITCADYRVKTNAVILLDTGHTLSGDHEREG